MTNNAPSDITDVYSITGSALKAQEQRIKVIAENIANANTTAPTPGQKPYQRHVITFKNEFDKALGAYKVEVSRVTADPSAFNKKYDPSSPAADEKGYVQTPNVNPIVEMMDMTDASHAYQANLNVIEAARNMTLNTIQLLQ